MTLARGMVDSSDCSRDRSVSRSNNRRSWNLFVDWRRVRGIEGSKSAYDKPRLETD